MAKKFQNKLEADFTASPEKYPQRRFKEKSCRWCGNIFKPIAPSHHYCSDDCRKLVSADKSYRRAYGVGVKWVLRQLDKQGWRCAICQKFGFKMRDDHISGLNLDHCHKTGAARGLLCHNCNRGIGLLQDDPNIMRRAALYIEGEFHESG